MTPILAAITLLITPSPRTDVALSCVDPGSSTPYRVAAREMDEDAFVGMSDDVRAQVIHLGSGVSWVFVRRADAVCHEIEDHQSHCSPWYNCRRHTGVAR